ncbi:MAG: nuclear transport factor 2 family protein [Verrucomicrobiota bacterium]|nr:nuclear transport factor 2 family protein [Verrucomicrobiota bacterium]
MKILSATACAALFFASVSGSVFAQDAPGPFLGISPAPSVHPAPAATPTPTPARRPKVAPAKPTPSAAPTPAAKSSPAEKSEERTAPSRRVLKEKPVRAVEPHKPFIQRLPALPRTGPRASRPTFDLTESTWVTAANIRSLENRWEDAIKNHDERALGELLAENFEGISTRGSEASKTRMLALLRRDKNVYRSARARGMSVRNLSPTIAVVEGVSTEAGVSEDGKKFSRSRHFTDKWKRHNGRWECVASRVSQIPQP